MHSCFPEQKSDVFYLTEGGTETETMYKFGHELPHFALFPLLDNPKAVQDLQQMFERYLDVVVQSGFTALMSGLDYRASPDWAKLLGYSKNGLAEMQHRSIEFLRNVAKPYETQIDHIFFAGIVGPRGDAYLLNKKITAEESEDYHSVQLENLKVAKVDFVWAATFNNTPEAIGLSRAAAHIGLPLCLSFTLDSSYKLKSGLTLKEAIQSVDNETMHHRPSCYGINCSHPMEFEPALDDGSWLERIRSIRPNAAMMEKISLCKLGHLEDGNPLELGEQMGSLAERYPHIDMWGGCCGTWEPHLKEIALQVSKAHKKTHTH